MMAYPNRRSAALKHRSPALWMLLPLGFVVGNTLQLHQASLWPDRVYAAVAVAAGALMWAVWRHGSRHRLAVTLAFLLAVAAMAFASVGWRASKHAEDSIMPWLEGKDLRVTGTVVGLPSRLPNGTRFDFVVDEAIAPTGRLPSHELPNRVRLGWYTNGGAVDPTTPDLRAGQRWALSVRLKAPHGNVNPGGFDYELRLWEQGIAATGSVRTGSTAEKPVLLASTGSDWISLWRGSVRDRIFRTLADPRVAGVVAALVVGDQTAIDRADWDTFRATGVAHLMSISGLHITAFAWLCMKLVRWVWRRNAFMCRLLPAQRAAVLGGVALAGGYALFSGWGVPAQRTVLMLTLVLGLNWFGKRWPWPVVWLWAMAIVCLWDPWALLQAGFWLSFFAVGILMAQPNRMNPSSVIAHEVVGDDSRWRRIFGRLYALMREQLIITLSLAPLSLVLFGQVSVVGLLANLFAIPLVTLLIVPTAMMGVLWSDFWTWSAGAVDALGWVLSRMAAWPMATYGTAQAPTWVGVLGVLGMAVAMVRMPMHWRALGAVATLPLLMWRAPDPGAGAYELLAADVGQGSAILVRTANHRLLYDAGPRYGPDADAGQRVLVPLLRYYDQPLDMVILSHRDADHTGGALPILAMQPKATVVGSLEPDHELHRVREMRRCEAGQTWTWDGVVFEFLHPSAETYAAARLPKSNAMSCVLRIDDGQRVTLLTGDIETEQELALVERLPERLRAHVLLVPHHGSRTSSSDYFLGVVSPKFAWIQAGYRNRFGHPSPVVVERYRNSGIHLFDTTSCGAISWSSSEPDHVRCERDARARYWHHRLQ